MKKVAILGPGLLGGSLALALKARAAARVALWARREAAVEEARRLEVADLASTELASVLEGADVVVFCLPVEAMPALARQAAPHLKPGALVTDVGSVKAAVVEALVPILEPRVRFVGSHPMAGSEQSGLSAARADLFEGATCIVTPHEGACEAAVAEVSAFWRQAGCEVRLLTPAAHDETVSLISHLPHLLAASLVDFVCTESPDAVNFCGNGFRDTTRVASGPAEMWTGIFASNRAALAGQLERWLARLGDVAREFAAGNDLKMNRLLTNAKIQRDRLKPKQNHHG